MERSRTEALELLASLDWKPAELELWRQGFEQMPQLIEAFRSHCEVSIANLTEKLISSENADARGGIKALRGIVETLDVLESALMEVENGS